MNKLLKLLSENAHFSTAELAAMLGESEEESRKGSNQRI